MSLEKSVKQLIEGDCIISFSDIINELLDEKHNLPFFNSLEDDEIKILLTDVILKKFLPNEIVFSQGEDKDNFIYYILNGSVNVMTKTESGFLKKVSLLQSGSLLGEMKFVLGGSRTATCIASANDTVVVGFTIKKYNAQHIDIYIKLYKNIIDGFVQKLQKNKIEFSLDKPDITQNLDIQLKFYQNTAIQLAKKLEQL